MCVWGGCYTSQHQESGRLDETLVTARSFATSVNRQVNGIGNLLIYQLISKSLLTGKPILDNSYCCLIVSVVSFPPISFSRKVEENA